MLVTNPCPPGHEATLPSLSVAPLTRPETLSLLVKYGPGAARQTNRIARGAAGRGDLALTAHGAASGAALSHIRHMLAGFGRVVEPLGAPAGTTRVRVRDVWQFHAAPFLAAAPAWLAGANAAMVNAASGLKLRKDGSASFGATPVDLVVLADDAAIVSRLAEAEVAAFAARVAHLDIATEPVAPLATPSIIDLDGGAQLAQDASGRLIGSAQDSDGRGLARITAALPEGVATRLAARGRSTRLLPHDGAPVLGPTRKNRLYVVAGLGRCDMALAPLVARLIVGKATPAEAEWAAAHGAELRQPRANVADFAPEWAGAA
ncbi:hypothetical protein [Pelagibacterium lacus]|uniref:Uncharacterized protein n=1 Tax=Pelagibacterium lacus TaxID=2282655 RepID=A0A369W6Y5_9HYPH|nr:hypothetical protein [Pelagibacterium lacus]RDE10454.1 hypothetical protein DVH29_00430 [Pelagibacterium lacus]